VKVRKKKAETNGVTGLRKDAKRRKVIKVGLDLPRNEKVQNKELWGKGRRRKGRKLYRTNAPVTINQSAKEKQSRG